MSFPLLLDISCCFKLFKLTIGTLKGVLEVMSRFIDINRVIAKLFRSYH